MHHFNAPLINGTHLSKHFLFLRKKNFKCINERRVRAKLHLTVFLLLFPFQNFVFRLETPLSKNRTSFCLALQTKHDTFFPFVSRFYVYLHMYIF